MKKIKLLYDATVVCNILENNSSRSGIFFVAYNLLMGFLKREEYEVYLYSKNPARLKKAVANFSELKGCKIKEYSVLDNWLEDLYNIKAKNKKGNNNAFVNFSSTMLISALRHVSDIYLTYFKNIEGIDAYFSPANAVPSFIAKNKNIKKYVFLHDTIPLINDYRDSAGHRWFYKLVRSINGTDKYFANSICTKEDFVKYVPKIKEENITVVPLSTGKPYFHIDNVDYIKNIKNKYGIPTDKKYIFSLCNLDPRKNLVFSIKNFLKFIEKHNLDDFIFVLGGSHFSDFKTILNKSIADLGEKQNKILRIGYVDDDDMSALYSGAEMFLFPSLYEGFGMPVLEAMKCALPVICSNTTSLPEVIGDCGIQINPQSDDEMISAMEKMYFDRDFRSECIAKGLERAKQFTWRKCIDMISDVIKEDVGCQKFQ